MQKRQLVRQIARRLPDMTALQVEAVLEVAAELWADDLQAGNWARIPGIGALMIDVQQLRVAGAIQREAPVRRVYGRFRPLSALVEQSETRGD
jgi:nucleoid DNA-binding protein